MDNPRPEKVAVVDEVRGLFDGSNAAILTEYRGLKVKDLAGLRRSLRPSGGEYKIYKNTLVRLAAKESGLDALEEMLVGPVGIAFVTGDAAAVAKALRDFSRTNPLLVIKGGILGEKVIDARETSALAELPSREVLLAQLAGAIAAPLQQLAGLMQALPRNLAYGLAALRDKKAEGDEPAGAAAEQPPADAIGADQAPVGESTAADSETPSDETPPAETPSAEAPPAEAPPAEAPPPEAPPAEAPPAEAPPAEAPPEAPSAEAPPAEGDPAATAASPDPETEAPDQSSSTSAESQE
jgi:large subunit ribosomal protein L10